MFNNGNGGYSLSDIAAVSGRNGNGFGGDGDYWQKVCRLMAKSIRFSAVLSENPETGTRAEGFGQAQRIGTEITYPRDRGS